VIFELLAALALVAANGFFDGEEEPPAPDLAT
jgi:hypothetical protein